MPEADDRHLDFEMSEATNPDRRILVLSNSAIHAPLPTNLNGSWTDSDQFYPCVDPMLSCCSLPRNKL